MAEWGLSPSEIDDLSARWMQDIALAEHAESYIKQTQRNQSQGSTKSNLENRSSKKKRIQEAKAKYN